MRSKSTPAKLLDVEEFFDELRAGGGQPSLKDLCPSEPRQAPLPGGQQQEPRRATTVLVVLDGQRDPEQLVEQAVGTAYPHGGRMKILTVPGRVPVCLAFQGFGITSPWSVAEIREEAMAEAVRTSAQAVTLTPPSVPIEHRVVVGSLLREMRKVMVETPVSHLLVERRLLRRRPLVRRSLRYWRQLGVEVVTLQLKVR
jgi:hypothetical protein